MPPSPKAPLSVTNENPLYPFALAWLDSCYQETLLPGMPWHVINEELCDALAILVRKQMSQMQRASILAKMLGDSFMAKYYPDVLRSLSHVTLEHISDDDQKKLALEASSWLKNQLLKAARQIGCLPDAGNTELSEGMKQFLKKTSNTFRVGLHREHYKQEQAAIAAVKEDTVNSDSLLSQYSYEKLPGIGNKHAHQPLKDRDSQPHHFRDHGAVSPAGSTASSSRSSSISSIKTERVRATIYNLDKKPLHPSMTSKSIELIAEAIVKLLERSPRKFSTVAKRLNGRLLPTKLRSYMWTESLYKAEREKLAYGVNVEKVVRERFGKTVARNVGELKIPRATRSPLHRLIENSVVEMYETVPALASCKYVHLFFILQHQISSYCVKVAAATCYYVSLPCFVSCMLCLSPRYKLYYRNKDIMKDAIKALNVLYVYDKTYQPYLILWLFPLQLAFTEQAESVGPEYVYELAMLLDILNSSLFMQWKQVYATADIVMDYLRVGDRELYDHLCAISQINSEVNAKDFVVEILQKERQAARELLSNPTESSNLDSQQLLSDPRNYIRKWTGEGFVGVLDTPSILFIWDQLFLQDWSSTVLQDFTLVLMLLLRERFLLCDDHMAMRLVFLHEPFFLDDNDDVSLADL
ncbi:UNC13D [Bugula neritina]|uniref:UNC13D n=1 Tax=Bugula neritina TaxID=10212 RepID=A0A7J7JSI5_BUGNE|nr:UNC13D [Bugula neritina]